MSNNTTTKKEILSIINQTIADTKYIKDDTVISTHIYTTFFKWNILYFVTNIFFLLYWEIGEIYNLFNYESFFSLNRIMTVFLYIGILLYYFYNIQKKGYSIKEKDFLKLYSLVPLLLIFYKLIIPISYYLNTDLLLSLCDSISLDLVTLIISSLLLKFYFKDSKLNFFVILNILIYITYLTTFSLFISSDVPSQLLISCFNIMKMMQSYGILVLLHFIIILFYIKRKKYNV